MLREPAWCCCALAHRLCKPQWAKLIPMSLACAGTAGANGLSSRHLIPLLRSLGCWEYCLPCAEFRSPATHQQSDTVQQAHACRYQGGHFHL